MQRRLPDLSGTSGRAVRPGHAVGDALHRRAAARRDRPRASRQSAHPRDGRADDRRCPRARRERLFALVRKLRAEGIAHHLYQPPHGGDLRTRGPRLRAARRRLCRHARRATRSAPRALVKMMVGRDLSSFYKKQHDPHGSRGAAVLEVKRRDRRRQRVKPAASSCIEGEVLGIAGLVGSGPHRTGAADLRRRPAHRRRDPPRRQAGRINAPRDAIDAGIVYLTEDRKRLGPVSRHVVRREHQSRRHRPRRRRLGRAGPRARPRTRSRGAFKALRVRVASPLVDGRQPVRRQPAEGAAVALAGDRARGC